MSTDLAKLDAPPVTSDQLDLVRRTVAAGATADELKLYLYDCARQGVHPLDKLLHFTKRGGKYTPVTSIDLMRTRAADTGEYAGSDVPLYISDDGVWSSAPAATSVPTAAMVTVYRLVQGQRCKFEAVARWQEYCPPSGQDHMWRKMPHTMLAKCAEALALRKGFPRQLAGLYAKEEMDQAGLPTPVPDRAPERPPAAQVPPAATMRVEGHRMADADAAPSVLETELPPAPVISDAQAKRLFAISRSAGWTTEALKGWLLSKGILSTKAITKADYDVLCKAIESGPQAVPQMASAEEVF